ncbi:MAG: tyrosine-type recombinase/integrase [Gammaproteobacteria bacterium]|nr:tyrosine-type recombinase/integrase [Gammaproteobacteria bacterium]
MFCALVERAGVALFKISAHTFHHSFAIYLFLHGQPLKVIGALLGHKSVEGTEVYNAVLSIEDGHFLESVFFHK